MAETREVNLTLDLCLRVGELLLANGAGAADVTATMQSIARHLGLRNPDIDVTFTSLSMSYQPSPEEPPLALMRQVWSREIDYEDLTRVDHLVRDLLSDRIGLTEARATVARIRSSGHHTRRWAVTLSWGVMSSGTALMLGGTGTVLAVSFLAAVLIDRTQLLMSRRRLPAFYLQVVGGLIAGGLAVVALAALPWLEPRTLSLMVTANIIMLLSGIGFMGALQDALTGFYVTSAARLIEALLATVGIITGVSGGLALAPLLDVELVRLQPGFSLTPEGVSALVLGAGLCASGFAFATYAPRRAVAAIFLVAGVAMLVNQAVAATDLGRTWSVGTAAFLIGLVAYQVAGRVRVPPLVLVVPAIVPMLPGLSIYRGLSLLAEGGDTTSRGLLAMITAASVAIALASGVILGEYVAQPLKREARRLESRLAGPRLVGPLRARAVRPAGRGPARRAR
ncbi:threonine/serine ThrE exporter family protein [Nocardioides perillae]|uniref:Uncharacterized membrane protein YjjP (DUF1212 family) n=1 Tax=Nocardioides perillae TaxID=1119534 RepID=A0A7Y9RX39_9ACTN|nr:threonine/serine exporter family protein [Nocardioides perillae]NYG56899.1 uncharacterized membrane protein YjjP (DUF1212 family) [Nocardioides perillae]